RREVRVDDLERDDAVRPQLPRPVDHAHAAAARKPFDPVTAERRARLQLARSRGHPLIHPLRDAWSHLTRSGDLAPGVSLTVLGKVAAVGLHRTRGAFEVRSSDTVGDLAALEAAFAALEQGIT